jgi:sodium/proline symporter
MSVDQVQIMIAMGFYLLIMIIIGFFYAKRASESTDVFFIGGRKLGPWITAAMSAEASDMSGWLLMGLAGRGILVRA